VNIRHDVPEGVCCVCGHKLSLHIDEGDGWQCHALDASGYQCECWLRKHCFHPTLDSYDLKKRRDSNEELASFLKRLEEDNDSESSPP